MLQMVLQSRTTLCGLSVVAGNASRSVVSLQLDLNATLLPSWLLSIAEPDGVLVLLERRASLRRSVVESESTLLGDVEWINGEAVAESVGGRVSSDSLTHAGGVDPDVLDWVGVGVHVEAVVGVQGEGCEVLTLATLAGCGLLASDHETAVDGADLGV